MPVTDQQFDALCTRIDAIDTNLKELVHGNGHGRTGFHTLLDDVYGPANRVRPGLIARVVLLETEVRLLAEQRKETKWMQRGIALGVSLVLIENTFGFSLTRVIGAWLGGTP